MVGVYIRTHKRVFLCSHISIAEDVEVFAGVEVKDGDLVAVGDGAQLLGADEELEGVALFGGDGDQEGVALIVGKAEGVGVGEGGV